MNNGKAEHWLRFCNLEYCSHLFENYIFRYLITAPIFEFIAVISTIIIEQFSYSYKYRLDKLQKIVYNIFCEVRYGQT